MRYNVAMGCLFSVPQTSECKRLRSSRVLRHCISVMRRCLLDQCYMFPALCFFWCTRQAVASGGLRDRRRRSQIVMDQAAEFQSNLEELLERYTGSEAVSDVSNTLEEEWLEEQSRLLQDEVVRKRTTTTTEGPKFMGLSTTRFVAACIVVFFMIVGCLASMQLLSKRLSKNKILRHSKRLAKIKAKVDADMAIIKEKEEAEREALEAEKERILEEKRRIEEQLKKEEDEKEKQRQVEEEMRIEAENAQRARQKEKDLKKKEKEKKKKEKKEKKKRRKKK
eukprot:gnl/MRDRNA2_/MRDRNA2_109393_c0_seq1.p1 gnl/MRDRNA2_/MRDRNA2_109393_c0~~gnl/MRDRNA2_/MRDRNA2_109393_c0_seq1.p1  ORF type:complete len:280 (+),score=72.60 gnl/MRDRNA2_/MRDRNA2_109393_c0_seq1:111-950(+)